MPGAPIAEHAHRIFVPMKTNGGYENHLQSAKMAVIDEARPAELREIPRDNRSRLREPRVGWERIG